MLPGLRRTTVLIVKVVASIASLKVAATLAPVLTAVAPLAGATLNTLGGIVSAASVPYTDIDPVVGRC